MPMFGAHLTVTYLPGAHLCSGLRKQVHGTNPKTAAISPNPGVQKGRNITQERRNMRDGRKPCKRRKEKEGV